MFKLRNLFTFLIIGYLFFSALNVAFAIEDVDTSNTYPDYSYEFAGKDKFEKFNRKLFMFNLKLNKYVIKPFNIGWCSLFPKCVMDRFSSFYTNTNFPVRAVSCAVQKDYKSSRREVGRFFVNLTVGLAGLYDPATSVFKMQSTNEDMEQALAYRHVKQGPYLVLPIVRGSIRDLGGKVLDCPLRPFSYIPFAGGIVNAVLSLNNLSYSQPLIKKLEETYADPYMVTRQIDGISMYIKANNLDRDDVFESETASQNIIKINNSFVDSGVKPDIVLNDYHPQSPLIDSMRTVLFDEQYPQKSSWTELSVWNHNFDKKIKTASVEIEPNHPRYKYRYILQKNKNAPLAIIYPSIGERITDAHSKTLTHILYDEGYSVVIQGSSFQWEFVQSMPDGYRPGLPGNDAKYLRLVSAKIIKDLEKKQRSDINSKIIIGSSFGALTTLFVAQQEEVENTLGVSKYISINPPIELIYALKQFDKNAQDWKRDSSDIKKRAAIAAEKAVKYSRKIANKNNQDNNEILPFTDDEAKLLTGFVMKQKLSDVVFAIEKNSCTKQCTIYDSVNKMSFYDYGKKYLFVNQNKSADQLNHDESLYILADFLSSSDKYKIYHTVDDYYVNPEQLNWLKRVSGNKLVMFSNGSHLGFLYRKEFVDTLKKDITQTANFVAQVNNK